MSVILMTTLFYKAIILQGEIWCWSLLGLKGLENFHLNLILTCILHRQNSPEWSPPILFKNKLRECDNRSKHFPLSDHFVKILITITLDYIILIGHYWEKQGWFAPMMYKLTPKSVQHIPVWMLCIVCSSRPSPVSCWYLPRFNFIFFLAPLISTHTLKRNFKISWLGEKGITCTCILSGGFKKRPSFKINPINLGPS